MFSAGSKSLSFLCCCVLWQKTLLWQNTQQLLAPWCFQMSARDLASCVVVCLGRIRALAFCVLVCCHWPVPWWLQLLARALASCVLVCCDRMGTQRWSAPSCSTSQKLPSTCAPPGLCSSPYPTMWVNLSCLSFIRVVFQWGASWWSLTGMVFHKGGLLSCQVLLQCCCFFGCVPFVRFLILPFVLQCNRYPLHYACALPTGQDKVFVRILLERNPELIEKKMDKVSILLRCLFFFFFFHCWSINLIYIHCLWTVLRKFTKEVTWGQEV